MLDIMAIGWVFVAFVMFIIPEVYDTKNTINCGLCVFVVLALLEVGSKALCILGKCYITGLQPKP